MDNSYDGSTLSFVIRLWLEEEPHARQPLHYRGHITQVVSGERRYFQDLAVPVEFIEMCMNIWRGEENGELHE